MGCGCTSQIHTNPPPPPPKGDCICINDVYVGCDNGPTPCGGAMQINLALYNNVTASPCPVKYMLKSYDIAGFQSVTLTEEGLLAFTTSANFIDHKYFEIKYKVDSPCTILSDEAIVYVCMKNLCKNKICQNGCDKCTGDRILLQPEISINGTSLNNEIGIN